MGLSNSEAISSLGFVSPEPLSRASQIIYRFDTEA